MSSRVVLIGAVSESLAAFKAILDHPVAELAGIVTLTEDAAQGVSGFVDLTALAKSAGVPALRISDANSPDAVRDIGALKPDLIAVVGWTRLIHEELLELPPRGAIGFHASLLPHNRGRAPVNWSLIRGETETGNTMMLLDRGVDTGQIIDQRTTPIFINDTCATVYERIADLGAQMLADNLEHLLAGIARSRPQSGAASELPKRVPAMGITDWDRSPQEVHNWIRGQTAPYPGAFSSLAGCQVQLWSSQPPCASDHHGPPGTVLHIGVDGIRVATRGGSLLITSVGTSTHDKQSPQDWCRETGVDVGDRFDAVDPETARWALGLGPRPGAVK